VATTAAKTASIEAAAAAPARQGTLLSFVEAALEAPPKSKGLEIAALARRIVAPALASGVDADNIGCFLWPTKNATRDEQSLMRILRAKVKKIG